MAHTTLDKWIEDCFAGSPGQEKAVSRFTLMHMQGAAQLEIHTYKIGGTHSVTPKELSTMFRNKAEVHSQELDGRQMFQLLAYFGSDEPSARFNIKITPSIDPMKAGLMTEPPDATGEKMQGMRHREALIGQVYQRQQTLDNHTLKIIETQARMLDQALSQNFQYHEMLKELMLVQANNQQEFQMKLLEKEHRKEREAALIKLAPALINSFTGRKLLPESTEDTAIVETIVDNLKEEHLAMLPALGLPEAFVGVLASRVQGRLKEKREKADKRKNLPAFRGSAEDDIAGGKPDE